MVKRTEARCLPGYPAPSAPSGRRIEPGTHSPPILEQSGYCKIGNSYLKQQNNHPRQKLRNLLIKRKMNIPEYLNEYGASCINLSYLSNMPTDTNTSRKFEKRNKRKRGNSKQNRKTRQLLKNYFKRDLSEGEQSALNEGLNFCPMRKKVNRTDAEVAFQRY